MIKPFKKKIRRNYYKVFDRNAEVIDSLMEGFNLMSEKLDEIIEQVNKNENRIKELEKESKKIIE